MAIKTTSWSPDTCDDPPCTITYTWDDSVDSSLRVHTPIAIVNTCTSHTAITTLANRWTALTDENPRKNKIISWVLANTSFTATQISWFFDASRVLNITVVGLTPTQKTAAQAWADTHLGVGKAIIIQG